MPRTVTSGPNLLFFLATNRFHSNSRPWNKFTTSFPLCCQMEAVMCHVWVQGRQKSRNEKNTWTLNNCICWRRKETKPQNISMTLQSDINAVNKYACSASLSLTIRTAGLCWTKAVLREECQERQRFWRSQLWWRGLQKEKEGRDKSFSMFSAATCINQSLLARHDWDSC